MVIFTRRVIIGAGILLALLVLLVPAQAGSCYIEGPGEAAAYAGVPAKEQLAAREAMEAAGVRMPVPARPARAPWGMDEAAVTLANPAAVMSASALETGLELVTGWAVVSEWLEWQKCLGGSSSDYGYSIQATPDGGYIMAGHTYSNDGDVSDNHGGGDAWVVKLDSTGNIQWQKCLGGSSDDYGYSIQPTSDDGYIMAGFTYSNDGDVSGNHGSYDAWVVKLDSTGNIQWQKCLGGSSNDYGYSIQTTTDGGYIMTGNTESNDGDVSDDQSGSDAWVVKLDSIGNIQWNKCIGGPSLRGTSDDYGKSIQTTSDGGYIMAGYTHSIDDNVSGNHMESDAWVVKLDSIGNIQWWKCLGGTGYDYGKSIQTTTDGGYIMTGNTESNDGDVSENSGGSDAWVVKLDSIGNIQWNKCIGGPSHDYGQSIQPTTDGGYIMAGNTVFYENDSSDAWVARLDSTGNIQWNKYFDRPSSDAGYSIQATPEGGYIMTGDTFSNDGDVSGNHGSYDAWVVKISPIEWQACYGGSGGDYIWDAAEIDDGGYVLLGETDSQDGDVSGNHGRQDAWVTRISSDGALLWQSCIGGSGDDYGRSIFPMVDGGYILAGYTTSTDGDMEGNHGGTDAWVAMVSATGSLQWVKCYGGSGEDYATTVGITYDDNNDIGYIVVGYTNSNDGDVSGNHGGYDLWAVRINQTGHILWQKCFGGSDDDYGSGLMPNESDDLFLKGYTRSNDGDVSGNHGGFDFWFLYTNSTGHIRAQACAGGSSDDYGYSTNWVLMGRTLSNDGNVSGNHGGYDAWTMVYNGIMYDGETSRISLGDMICLGGSNWDEGRDIDYSYESDSTLMVGSSQSNDGDAFGNHGGWDMWAVCLLSDHMGGWDYAWSRCFGGSGSDYGSAVVPCSDGGWLLAGYTGSNNGDLSGLAKQEDYDAWVVKLRP